MEVLMRMMRTLAVAAAAAAALTLSVAGPSQAAGTSDVSVLHGVPGLNVDVYANGDKILTDFKPGDLAGPLKLPEGSYDLAVFATGDDPATATPAIKADGVKVPSGANITVVAHLNAATPPAPVLTAFVNDTSKLAAGQARLTVRHTAAAPAVDVRAGGTPVFKDLTNPNEAKADIAAGTVSADVVLAGTDTVAIGPADLKLAEGTNTIVYAWGSADAGYKLAVQTLTGLHSAPSGVPSGTGGLQDGGLPLPLVALMVIGAGGAVLAGRRLVAQRG
jgi:hypothetical protein